MRARGCIHVCEASACAWKITCKKCENFVKYTKKPVFNLINCHLLENLKCCAVAISFLSPILLELQIEHPRMCIDIAYRLLDK